MKLLRFGTLGQEKPALMDKDGNIRDISSLVDDICGATLSQEGLDAIASSDHQHLPIVPKNTRIGVPVGNIGKCICIGLNYADHAAETGATVPGEPMIFMKATSAICGPNDTVILPRGSMKSDWEIELAFVMGKAAKYVSEEKALEYVAGYTIMNDVSERHFQKERAGQMTKGKSCDNFGPLGPYLVTKDEIADPQNLAMKLSLNGEIMQDGSSKTMVYGVKFLVSYLSQFMTLQAGDVISTGTPPGVGLGMSPPRFLKAGDVMALAIEGLGEQRQIVVAD